jgi:hypothetical protein
VLVASANAQITTARLAGVVKDPSGSVIENAEITITNEHTGAQRTVRTNGDGLYVAVSFHLQSTTFTSLPPGSVELRSSTSLFP